MCLLQTVLVLATACAALAYENPKHSSVNICTVQNKGVLSLKQTANSYLAQSLLVSR
jgi:hypothetical protein